MYLAHVCLEISSSQPPGSLRTAIHGCIAGAVKEDPDVVLREQKRFPADKLLMSNAKEILEQHNAQNAETAMAGLFSLRHTPMKREANTVEWNSCDEMVQSGALLLSHFATSPAKVDMSNQRTGGGLSPPAGRKIDLDLHFSVFQDQGSLSAEEAAAGGGVGGPFGSSGFPPPQSRGAARSEAGRWSCEGCSLIFATRDILRAHCRNSGHLAMGEKLAPATAGGGTVGMAPGSAQKRKQGLAEQPANMQPLYVTSSVDRAGKRQAHCQAVERIQQSVAAERQQPEL